jgi:hypothetical protein
MGRTAEIGRYLVISDNGTEYTIIESQYFISIRNADKSMGEIPGVRDLITTTGKVVNAINDTTFQIAGTKEILHKV